MIYLKQCIILRELDYSCSSGYSKRVLLLMFLVKMKKPTSFINPVIKNLSDETSVYEEGCLSIPETFIEIERPKICVVEYIDLDGKKND